MNALGKHILLELKDCNREALNDLGFLKETLIGAAGACGATVVGETFHLYSPQGVSGVVTIAESHLFIHTWPEYGYAAADIFTCGTAVEPEKAAEVIIERLESKNHSVIEIQRGLMVVENSLVKSYAVGP
ncbi:MAG: adenosylmethionine decarboxylase [Chloroflexi bacterium]|nr:adenosylmethionine decarboxylase [Chloroflexota bacterium]